MREKKTVGEEILTQKQLELIATHCRSDREAVGALSKAARALRRAAHRWHTAPEGMEEKVRRWLSYMCMPLNSHE